MVELIPKYSYEYYCILNPEENQMQRIQGFASLLSDKERFLPLVSYIDKNEKFIENYLGTSLPQHIEFYVVRAEKFLSFSEPITVEYSLFPEKMLLFLLKEIIKVSIDIRFPDDETRESHVNSFVEFIIENGAWPEINFSQYFEELHKDSKENFPNYEKEEIDFSDETLREKVEKYYEKW